MGDRGTGNRTKSWAEQFTERAPSQFPVSSHVSGRGVHLRRRAFFYFVISATIVGNKQQAPRTPALALRWFHGLQMLSRPKSQGSFKRHKHELHSGGPCPLPYNAQSFAPPSLPPRMGHLNHSVTVYLAGPLLWSPRFLQCYWHYSFPDPKHWMSVSQILIQTRSSV